MTARWLTMDVFDGLATLNDGSVDLVITSPPFLALRSYLPADHPDKAKEIGSEPTPAAFIDVLLAVTAELRRVLAPHGSICVELGDTYASDQGRGPDWTMGGERFTNDGPRRSFTGPEDRRMATVSKYGEGWPLAKSKTLIPELYRLALAYGINPLTGQPSPAGKWRVRNVVTWCRPNPPVGALGDKWRPATSDIVIACTSDKRYWDDIATRRPLADSPGNRYVRKVSATDSARRPDGSQAESTDNRITKDYDPSNSAGAPLLDYWEIPPGGYSGKVLTVHREPCGPDDGGERTTSPDCPVHGDQADQAPTAPDGGRAGTSPTRTPRTDARHASTLPLDSESTDATPDRSGSSPSPTSEQPDPECSPAATPRSKASSKTAPAPGTTTPDTPSAETLGRTGGKPESPESDERRPDNPESNTSEGGSLDSPELQSPDRTAGSDIEPASSEACSCSWSKVVKEEYTSHYAVYPPALVEPLIKAMAPPKVCETCGEPSRRIVEQTEAYAAFRQAAKTMRKDPGMEGAGKGQGGLAGSGYNRDPNGVALGSPGAIHRSGERLRTAGWSDCSHDNWRPAHILDPFAGSGTTLAVATGHGHDATGIDLDPRNADLARDRIGPLLFDEVEL